MAGEAPIKQAVKWIDDQLIDNPGADRVKLVDDASRRFDLSPLDADFLFRHLAERAKKMVPGDPLDPKTRLGALSSKAIRQPAR